MSTSKHRRGDETGGDEEYITSNPIMVLPEKNIRESPNGVGWKGP